MMTRQQTPFIKICGIRDIDTAVGLAHLPIDAVGFVFAPSKRRVTATLAAECMNAIREQRGAKRAPLAAGVFVNESLEGLREVIDTAGLDVVQLHGAEDPEMCKTIRGYHNVKVWRALSATSEESAYERLAPYAKAVDAVLIDAPRGGGGKPFDWQLIGGYYEAARSLSLPLYIAGGLRPDNVRDLLDAYSLDGVDVSSGVETDGQKDLNKIREFVERVMEA